MGGGDLVTQTRTRTIRTVLNLAVPRTGSVYVSRTLDNVRPHGHYCLTRSDWSFSAISRPPQEWLDEDFVVAFVRNPFDLLVSVYSMLRRPDALAHKYAIDHTAAVLDFRDWVALVANRRHHWPQAYPLFFQLFADDWTLGVDYLGRYETLDQDLTQIARLTGGTFTPAGRMNASERWEGWRDYYDDATIEQVRRAYAADLLYFGYGLNGVSDRSITTFGPDPKPSVGIVPRNLITPWTVEGQVLP
jgi:hypothetical protein